jgi:ABC-type enterochelin transport system permease subunit
MIKVLFFVSILMAVSVSMIGPMIFLGFLVAMLAYQFADTFDHRVHPADGRTPLLRRSSAERTS